MSDLSCMLGPIRLAAGFVARNSDSNSNRADARFIPLDSLACVSVRLTLHLRSYSSSSDYGDTEEDVSEFAQAPGRHHRRRSSWLGASTLEVPGELSSVGGLSTTLSIFELRDLPNDGCFEQRKNRESDFESYQTDSSLSHPYDP